ncbi:glycosyl hydrolase family 32 [Pseudoroseicyclus aestuarii]|uniref:Beta-fructofuranosidase n=1 Tax=Pseudoroseicyclus aestuarii TaxID=1795041 RepID=A0A318ST78_9RHOB|nr:glycosyl hydrolase family 32 [Pseudoroseicyclus aestuarii]PYE81337.1 beta-fructofuranosidase [Pseudoroseicyclus aestuarii]
MSFEHADHWVWDIWFAEDGDLFHMFYLHAPRALGDPHLRHRNARIGHATSADLRDWTDHGRVFDAGPEGSFDASATWTGSTLRGDDGLWRMFYTGSVFLEPDTHANIEMIGLAVSRDLQQWGKRPGVVLAADPALYETLGTSDWPEEAWRDPWVFRPEGETLWHMLVTARATHGAGDDRGVIGHMTSEDLEHWTPQPALSAPGAGFAHLEVPQVVAVEGQRFLVFSCDGAKLCGERAGQRGGVWAVAIEADLPAGGYPIHEARLICDERLYAGRVVIRRDGQAVLMAFENEGEGGFIGRVADPVPLTLSADGRGLVPAQEVSA